MKATLHVNTTGAPKLEGYREPTLAQSACGHPIIPSKGDMVVINSIALVVDDVIWHLHQDIEKQRIEVYVSAISVEKTEVPESDFPHDLRRVAGTPMYQCARCRTAYSNPENAKGATCRVPVGENAANSTHSLRRVMASTDWMCEWCGTIFFDPKAAEKDLCPGPHWERPSPQAEIFDQVEAILQRAGLATYQAGNVIRELINAGIVFRKES